MLTESLVFNKKAMKHAKKQGMTPTREKSNQEKRFLTKLRGLTYQTRTPGRAFDACPKAKQRCLQSSTEDRRRHMSRGPDRNPGVERCNDADLTFEEGAEGPA